MLVYGWRGMNILITPALAEDAETIMPLMNAEDRAKVNSQELPLLLSFSTVSWSGRHAGQPMCIGGVLPNGMAWMISTPELNRQKRFFLRQSKTIMAMIADRFAGVSVVVDPCYFRSVRWLLWLGFKLDGEGQIAFRDEMVPVQRFRWVRQ